MMRTLQKFAPRFDGDLPHPVRFSRKTPKRSPLIDDDRRLVAKVTSRKEASSGAIHTIAPRYSQSATHTDTGIKIYYYDRVSYRKQRGDGGPSSRSFTCARHLMNKILVSHAL